MHVKSAHKRRILQSNQMCQFVYLKNWNDGNNNNNNDQRLYYSMRLTSDHGINALCVHKQAQLIRPTRA